MPLKMRGARSGDDGAERRAEEQHERDDDDPRRPGPHVAGREQPAEVRLDHVREMPGDEQRRRSRCRARSPRAGSRALHRRSPRARRRRSPDSRLCSCGLPRPSEAVAARRGLYERPRRIVHERPVTSTSETPRHLTGQHRAAVPERPQRAGELLARRRGRAPGRRAPARVQRDPVRAGDTDMRKALALRARAPGARHSRGWQSCRAAPPMPAARPASGPRRSVGRAGDCARLQARPGADVAAHGDRAWVLGLRRVACASVCAAAEALPRRRRPSWLRSSRRQRRLCAGCTGAGSAGAAAASRAARRRAECQRYRSAAARSAVRGARSACGGCRGRGSARRGLQSGSGRSEAPEPTARSAPRE